MSLVYDSMYLQIIMLSCSGSFHNVSQNCFAACIISLLNVSKYDFWSSFARTNCVVYSTSQIPSCIDSGRVETDGKGRGENVKSKGCHNQRSVVQECSFPCLGH